jgi:SAM-dependent methyltransferase
MNIYSELARIENLVFTLIESPIEDCTFNHKFEFIFSINVMEHLNEPFLVLTQIKGILKKGSKYRFFCPNYDFPYEPHFGKILWKRKRRSFYLEFDRARRSELKSMDSVGLYNSLNFITVAKLQAFSKETNLLLKFNSQAFYHLLQRSMSDPGLRARHRNFVPFLDFLSRIKFMGLSKLLPTRLQPVMDVILNN